MSKDVLNIFSDSTKQWFQNTLGSPTLVQEQAWPAISNGNHTLVSAPTGTGKTLTAFLVFIDKLKELAKNKQLMQELQLIYISPLKSLASDIRENLRRPLDGIESTGDIDVAIRTGDTTQEERRRMIKTPPHILITTPESLFLMLTSKTGQTILHTTKAIVIDELHALIDTKRGAHLMLSIARLDKLCDSPVQRIGLSATIEPLKLASEYLSPDEVTIVAPKLNKKIEISITSPIADYERWLNKDPIWQELAKAVYEKCLQSKSVIAFVEGRRYAEKLAYFVNELGGDGFAKAHHGSLSKEFRLEVEQSLRSGELRLLCATSSMELGIDVGEIDQVLQLGCPRTISSTMQRLGRAGHNPGKTSVMHMYPRTSSEGLYCGITAEIARNGGIEQAKPPMNCLDILAQHLVSMAAWNTHSIDDVMDMLSRSYSFSRITEDDIHDTLCMLSGDFEHKREIPVRPRIIYDRINKVIYGDPYSRLLATSAGGTIPDKGMYTVRTEDGVKLGELDEEFVFESRVGESFLLGTFAWKIVNQSKDSVIVAPASTSGAKLPFWKGEMKGRSLETSIKYGEILGKLDRAYHDETLNDALADLGMDESTSKSAYSLIERQINTTGTLPNNKTIVIEHFRDHTGIYQVMVHSHFGRQVNDPLSLLMQRTAEQLTGTTLGCVSEEAGFLIFPYNDDELPNGIIQQINIKTARAVLEAILPATSVFNITFRYNAARALMMGAKGGGRTPLWLQRLRSTEMLDSLVRLPNHPIVRETKRECLDDNWDISGVEFVLNSIHSGTISVVEQYSEIPSPLSLPFQWQIEAAVMYDYTPTTSNIQRSAEDELAQTEMIAPATSELSQLAVRTKFPQDEEQLHSLLMIEGDMLAGELPIPVEWLTSLSNNGRIEYIEPGLWIATEHSSEYSIIYQDKDACCHIIRRMLYYRGAQSSEQISDRYFIPQEIIDDILSILIDSNSIVENNGLYYHARLYNRARRETIKAMRREIKTLPPEKYSAFIADRTFIVAPAEEQVKRTLRSLCGRFFSAQLWESVILPARVNNYRESLLDTVLSQGEFYWRINSDKEIAFFSYDNIDWTIDTYIDENISLTDTEQKVYAMLVKRGASFMKSLTIDGITQHEALISLAEKGLVTSDSFSPIRQWLNQDKINKSTTRQRVNSRMNALINGRWDIVHSQSTQDIEQKINDIFSNAVILCRETAALYNVSWQALLNSLRIWEYTGRARRGYFIQGLSGAQFIRDSDFNSVMQALESTSNEIYWLTASDPSQLWGKLLPHVPDRAFANLAGNAVAIIGGLPIAVFERQGKLLRSFDDSRLELALKKFVLDFRGKRIYPSLKRIILKEFPPEASDIILSSGFLRDMQGFMLIK